MGAEKTNGDANQVDEEENRGASIFCPSILSRSTLPGTILSQRVGDRIDLYPVCLHLFLW